MIVCESIARKRQRRFTPQPRVSVAAQPRSATLGLLMEWESDEQAGLHPAAASPSPKQDARCLGLFRPRSSADSTPRHWLGRHSGNTLPRLAPTLAVARLAEPGLWSVALSGQIKPGQHATPRDATLLEDLGPETYPISASTCIMLVSEGMSSDPVAPRLPGFCV